MEKPPQIYAYDNYRTFLRDFYDFKKAQKKAFSFRFLAKAAGFASPNFFHLVMAGKRNLTHESIQRVTQALKLHRQEAEFFRHLVLFNQAKSPAEKATHAEALMRSKIHQKLKPLAAAQYEYWTHWYFVVIRELVRLPSFRDDPQWIAQALAPPITPKEVENALEKLATLGLLARNEKGHWVQTEAHISSGDEITSTSVIQFHRQMIELGKESIDRFHSHERQISSVTLELSEPNIQKVREMINEFRKELVAVANRDPHPQNIFQMNFQFFPLTHISDKKKQDATAD